MRDSNLHADLSRQIDRFGYPKNSQFLLDATARTFPIWCSVRRRWETLFGGRPRRALRLPLYQALQLAGHIGVEWLEDLVLPAQAFLVINRDVSQGKIIVRAREVGF